MFVNEVQKLIACASRVELKRVTPQGMGRASNPTRVWSFPIYTMEIPASNIAFRSRNQARFSKILDSIANLAGFAPLHEVYAVALQGAPRLIQLVIAGNDADPRKLSSIIELCGYYCKIWLKIIPQHHHLPVNAESPPQSKRNKLPASARGRIVQFEREAFKFCCAQ